MKFLLVLAAVVGLDHITGIFSSTVGLPMPITQRVLQQTIIQPPCPPQPWTSNLKEI